MNEKMQHIKNQSFKYYIGIFFIITFTQQNHTQTNFSKDLPSGLSDASIINVNDTIISEIKVEKNYWLPAVEIITSQKEHDLNVTISLGTLNAFFNNKFNYSRSYAHLDFDLKYDNQFTVSSHEEPFDYFTVHTSVNIGHDDNIVGLLNTGIEINHFANTGLGLNVLLYERFGNYKNFPNTQTSNSAIRLFLSQNI